jgi:RHS repeat-associated protein
MKRVLNVLLILAFAFNQAVFYHPVQAAVSQSQPAAAVEVKSPFVPQVSHEEAPGTLASRAMAARSVTPTPRATVSPTPRATATPAPAPVDSDAVIGVTSDAVTSTASDWQTAALPALAPFQTSQFTGAGTYQFSLQLPAGPGGFQPEVSLSYNSQVVDQAKLTQQASSQGMGWTLSGGYIDRISDDIYSLVLNGVSHKLLKVANSTVAGPDNFEISTYRTQDDMFWRIQFAYKRVEQRDPSDFWEVSYWKIWDKNGNAYEFGVTDALQGNVAAGDHDTAYVPYREVVHNDYGDVNFGNFRVWRWGLTRVRNPFDKTIEYKYDRSEKTLKLANYFYRTVQIDIRPSRIVYPNQKYQVIFNYVDRQDLDPAWGAAEGDNAQTFYSVKRLDNIVIQHNSATPPATPTWTTVRGYILGYNERNQNIFSGYSWPVLPGNSVGAKTLTLTSISEFYGDENNKQFVPAKTTFTYDGFHLTEADNGYGGKVSLDYSNGWHADNGSEAIYRYRWNNVDNVKASVAFPTPTATTHWYMAIEFDAAFDYQKKFRPGGYYLVEADIYTYHARLVCIGDGNDATKQCENFGENDTRILKKVVYVDKNASQFTPGLYCDVDGTQTHRCNVHSIKVTYLPTYYRVYSKTITDATQGSSQVYTYAYQGAALNDWAHSAVIRSCYYADGVPVANAHCLTPQYAEFRGHSAVTETGPDGRSTTTWFYQDDERAGRAQASQTMQSTFYDGFAGPTLNSGQWYAYTNPNNPNTGETVETSMGDSALKIHSAAGDQMAWLGRTVAPERVGQGKAAQFQFRVDDPGGTYPRVAFYIRNYITTTGPNPTGPDMWGLRLESAATNPRTDRLVSDYYLNGQPQANPNNNLIANFQYGHWYVVWLVASSDRLLVRVKDRDDPTIVGRYEIPTPAGMTVPLYFTAEAYGGTVWMDEYREGYLYQLNETQYTVTNNLVATDTYFYTVKPIHWVRADWNKAFTFERGSTSVVRMVQSYYDTVRQGGTQYGNLTRTQESEFNGSAFVTYRASETLYYPFADATRYLVGLPGEAKQFTCPADGCTASNATLLSDTQYLYNGSSNPGAQPTAAKLTGERRLLRWTDAINKTGPLYSDVNYGYDAWGNRVSATQYTQEGTGTVRATGGAQTSVTCYGAEIPGETCADDGYYTYPLWQKQSGMVMGSSLYNKALGLLTQETDANGAITGLFYDGLGRLIKVARPGDSEGSPSLQVTYHNFEPAVSNPATPARPFWTEAIQKTGATNPPGVRKFYNGLGELIQTQQVGVEVADAACSGTNCAVIVDQKSEYVSGVKTTSQTAPYAAAIPSGYVAPTWPAAATTKTTYDILGRPLMVKAPGQTDTTSQRMSYGLVIPAANVIWQQTITKDPKNNVTESWKDIWGRTTQVKAADGPVLAYTYDVADRLTAVEQRDRSNNTLLATTSLVYDVAGRKTQMTDPDMGVWKYDYDALSNLKWQLDARNQRICLYYDNLNRLTGKEYRSNAGGCVGAPLAVTFTYDQTTDGNMGKGRRTAMNDLSGSTTWTYDARGRLTKEVKAINGAGTFMTQWAYNAADQVQTMTYPGGADGSAGEVVTNTYNAQMASTGVAGTDTYLYGATYDAAGRVATRKYGAAQKLESFLYYPWNTNLGLLKQHTVAGLLDLSYPQTDGYDKNGNILKIVDTTLGQTQTFTYDTINRLTSAKACLTATPTTCDYDHTGTRAYGYDNYGRLTTQPGGVANSLTYGNSSHIHAVMSAGDGSSYTYDANGNAITRNSVPFGRITRSYTLGYDAENRLVDVSNGAVANFIYDGDGNRVLGTVDGVSTVYIGNYYEAQLGQAAQRVANPSFKNQGANSYTSANWTQEGYNSAFPATSFFRSAWGLGAGNNDTYGQAISNLAYGEIRSDSIPVVPGTQYDLRAYVRGKIDQEESVDGWHVRAFFYDASDTYVTWREAAGSKAITETWQQQGGIVTVPANATKLQIALYAVEVSGWVAFDDVSLVQVGTTANLAVNAGFENGSGLQATNWREIDDTGSNKFPGTGYFRYVWGIAAPRSGSYAYAISNLAYNVLQADKITLEANAQYDLYTYVRGALDPSVTVGSWILRARYYNTAGNEISSSDVAGSSPLTTTWQRFGGRVTPPANAAKIQIQLYNVMSSGWVAFDDVSLVKVGGNGANLVLNPGFETGSDTLPTNWTRSGEASSSFPASSYWRGTWGVTAPHSENCAYAAGNLAYGALKSDLVPAQANTQYDLSVYVQGYRDLNASGGYPILRIVALDSNNTQLIWAVNNVSWLDLAGPNITNSSSYQRYGGRFLTPANTVNLRVELHFGLTTGWASFDDVALTPVQSTLTSFTKYYYAGGQRIARRTGTGSVEYLFSDHLGSSSLVTNSSFVKTSEMRYTAWGKPRSITGTIAANAFTYTGQRQEAGIALNFYNARWYDPNIAHFAQTDIMVSEPGNSKTWDRYAYVNNNPVRYSDPSGHLTDDQILAWTGSRTLEDVGPEWLALLRAAILGDSFTINRDTHGIVYSGHMPSGGYTIGLGIYDGKPRLNFSGGMGSLYLEDMKARIKNMEMDMNYITLYRHIDGQKPEVVYEDGKYLNGWRPIPRTSTTSVDGWGRAGVVVGSAVLSGASAFGATCAIGAATVVGAAPVCGAVSPITGLAIGIATGIGVGWLTDKVTANAGTMEGDVAYSYAFANGKTVSTVVRGNNVLAISPQFFTNQSQLIGWGITPTK